EVLDLLLGLHELLGLFTRPRPLCFVKDHHVLVWRLRVTYGFVAKMMNVLNKTRDLAVGIFLVGAFTNLFVPGQCLPQDSNQWPISRQNHGMLVRVLLGALRSDIAARQRLACPRYAGHQTDSPTALLFGLVDYFGDTVGRNA